MRTHFLIAAAATAALGTVADAEIIYGLTTQNSIVVIDSDMPSVSLDGGFVSGLEQNETPARPRLPRLRRPSSFAVGSGDNLYTIDQDTFDASLVGQLQPPAERHELRLRLQPRLHGRRVRPASSATRTTTASSAATPASTWPRSRRPPSSTPPVIPTPAATPNVVGIAYTNSVPGATTTQQYGIDRNTGDLVTVANNAGTLDTVGSLGFGDPASFTNEGRLRHRRRPPATAFAAPAAGPELEPLHDRPLHRQTPPSRASSAAATSSATWPVHPRARLGRPCSPSPGPGPAPPPPPPPEPARRSPRTPQRDAPRVFPPRASSSSGAARPPGRHSRSSPVSCPQSRGGSRGRPAPRDPRLSGVEEHRHPPASPPFGRGSLPWPEAAAAAADPWADSRIRGCRRGLRGARCTKTLLSPAGRRSLSSGHHADPHDPRASSSRSHWSRHSPRPRPPTTSGANDRRRSSRSRGSTARGRATTAGPRFEGKPPPGLFLDGFINGNPPGRRRAGGQDRGARLLGRPWCGPVHRGDPRTRTPSPPSTPATAWWSWASAPTTAARSGSWTSPASTASPTRPPATRRCGRSGRGTSAASRRWALIDRQGGRAGPSG